MRLEHWDPIRKKYLLYLPSTGQREADCALYPYDRIPRRVFLDTNVINLLVKWRAQVFDHEPIPDEIDNRLAFDIEALMHVFYVGSSARWNLVGSPKTLGELEDTPEPELRDDLLDYGICIVNRNPDDEDRKFTIDFGRRLVGSSLVAPLRDPADQELIGHAIALGCDVFCTCDRKTIVTKRDRLRHLPIRILTPVEWWWRVKPWAGLWE